MALDEVARRIPNYYPTARRLFGSSRAAFEAARLPVNARMSRRNAAWTKRAFVAELRRLARERLRATEYQARLPGFKPVAARLFGSIPAAFAAAGVTPWRPAHLTAAELEAEIRRLAALGHTRAGELATHIPDFHHQAKRLFGNVERARRAAGIEVRELRPARTARSGPRARALTYSRAEILKVLRDLAATHGAAFRAQHVATRPAVYRRMLQLWGTFAKARRAIGLPPTSSRHWTIERCIAELKRLDREGVRITGSGLRAAGRGGMVSSIKAHGGLIRVRELAGLRAPPRASGYTPKHSWDSERVRRTLLRMKARGEDLSPSCWDPALRSAAGRYYGGVGEALATIGVAVEDVARRPTLNDEQILARLRSFAAANPAVTAREAFVRAHGSTVALRFGSFAEGVRRAGLVDWPRLLHRRLSKEEVLEALRARHAEGASMSTTALRRETPALSHSATKHFGSPVVAMHAAGIPHAQAARSARTKAWILDEIRRRHDAGLPMHAEALRQERAPVLARAIYQFGGWAQAVLAAGLADPRLRRG